MEVMQEKIDGLQAENNQLQGEVKESKETCLDLKAEVEYLRGIIQNQSQLAALIKGVQNAPGVKFRFGSPEKDEPNTRLRRKRAAEEIATSPNKNSREGGSGICLHVQEGEVSVEFCGRCNRQSREYRILFPRDLLLKIENAARHREM